MASFRREKNIPMMLLVWLRTYTAPNGSAKGQAFCTTLGASDDMLDKDLRRLFVNTAFYLTGLKVADWNQWVELDLHELGNIADNGAS